MTAPDFTGSPRLGVLKTKTILGTSPSDLDTQVATFITGLGAGTERLVPPIWFEAIDATHLYAFVVYVAG